MDGRAHMQTEASRRSPRRGARVLAAPLLALALVGLSGLPALAEDPDPATTTEPAPDTTTPPDTVPDTTPVTEPPTDTVPDTTIPTLSLIHI